MSLTKEEMKDLIAEALQEAQQQSTAHCQFGREEVQTIKDFCQMFKWIRESAIKAFVGAIIVGTLSAIWYAIPNGKK